MKILYKIFFLFLTAISFTGMVVSAQSNEQNRMFNNAGDKRIVAYPIPANNIVYFKLTPNLRAEAKTVELVSVIGRTVAVQKVTTDNEDIVFSNLNQLPEGVYVGVTKNAEGKIINSTKIVIQR
jgi:hypothetical protein